MIKSLTYIYTKTLNNIIFNHKSQLIMIN